MINDVSFGPIQQVAYIVADLDQSILMWNQAMGIGPFAVARNVQPLEGSVYRGEESHGITINLGFAYIDNIQLELIQPCDEQPSIYREALDAGHTALHHYGFLVEDYETAYQDALNAGYQAIVDAGQKGWARMAYMELQSMPGLISEIIEWNDNTRPYFDGVKDMLSAADSKQLIHEFSL
ncbi:MAG: hypothetical protein HOC23_14000 [Halieaceae bacterium]|jgi:hypothetical protein|nr:hypothetical protein [Halieaceae bacterium]